MKKISAVILAGGLGTRLRSIVSDNPKSMANICGRPFLEYQINFLKKQGISNIILCTGYLGEQIVDYFLDGTKFGVHISYSHEKEPLGTGGAIKNAIDMLQDNFLLLNGDSITIFSIDKLISFHQMHNSDTTLVLTNSNQSRRYGGIIMDMDHKITSFTEKGNHTHYISTGVYLMKKNSVQWNDFPTKFSLESDLFPVLVKQKNMYGFISNDYFIDIGVPDDFKRFENHVSINYNATHPKTNHLVNF